MLRNKKKYYLRLIWCSKISDTPLDRRNKLLKQIECICIENQEYHKADIVKTLLADFKGQKACNEAVPIVAMCITIIIGMFGVTSWYRYKNIVFILIFVAIIILLIFLLFNIKFLYMEGFVIEVLEKEIERF